MSDIPASRTQVTISAGGAFRAFYRPGFTVRDVSGTHVAYLDVGVDAQIITEDTDYLRCLIAAAQSAINHIEAKKVTA